MGRGGLRGTGIPGSLVSEAAGRESLERCLEGRPGPGDGFHFPCRAAVRATRKRGPWFSPGAMRTGGGGAPGSTGGGCIARCWVPLRELPIELRCVFKRF